MTLDNTNKNLSVMVISSNIGRSPNYVTRSFIFDEVYRLAKRGVELHVVRSRVEESALSYGIYFHGLRKKVEFQAIITALRNLRIYPPISLLRNPKYIYRENRYMLNVLKVLERFNVNLIHAHFAYLEGWTGILTKMKAKKPLIVTLHGYDILTEQATNYGIRHSKRFDAMIRKVINESEAVIVASKAVLNEAKKIMKNHERLHLISNGVDIVKFNPTLNGMFIRNKLGINGPVVFTLRHHEPKYGIEYLIKAAALVIKERKDAVFIIGGDGSLKKQHELLVEKLGIKDHVIFTGTIPQSQVPYYFAASDVVAVPSIQEAFGLIVSEAMACGKPVVGTNVGGIPDQIIDGYNGFLVKPKDHIELSEKILLCINDSKMARRMGANGRKIVEDKFNIEKRIDRIISLYKRLL